VFISCAVKDPSLVKKKEITYQTGFPFRDPYGIFFNLEDNTEYFYVSEMGYIRKLLFFTINGKKKIEISTDSLADWRSTDGIVIKSLDTIIFIMTDHGGTSKDRIVFMDRNGKRWKKIELGEIPSDENNFKYHFYLSFITHSFSDDSSVFFNTGLTYDVLDSTIRKSRNQDLILKTIIPLAHKAHILLKYNVYTNQYQFALSDMWRRVCPDTNSYILAFHFSIENNFLLLYDFFGNEIYILDKNTFDIYNKIDITSPYTGVGVPPSSMEDRISPFYYNGKHGRIINILYDKFNQLYYLILRHTIDDPLLSDEASFSIQIYDTSFKKLTEQIFEGTEYDYKSCLVCSQGLLIRHSPSQKKYNPNEVKYDLYKIKR
jgi:hypothetical protein